MINVARAIALAALSGLVGLTAITSANAGGSLKDEPMRHGFSWTGFYVGGHAGLGTGNSTGRPEAVIFEDQTFPIVDILDPDFGGLVSDFFSTDYNMSGATFGAHVGYNFQSGNVVYGIEGSYSGYYDQWRWSRRPRTDCFGT